MPSSSWGPVAVPSSNGELTIGISVRGVRCGGVVVGVRGTAREAGGLWTAGSTTGVEVAAPE